MDKEKKKNDWIMLKDLKFNSDGIFGSWEYIGNHSYRIYFEYDKDIGSGFNAIVIERISSSRYWEDNWLDDDDIEIRIRIIAYFDGIRHMNFGNNEDIYYGYINYPNLNMLKDIFTDLQKLEKKYCRDPHNG